MSETRTEVVRLFVQGGGKPALPVFSRALDTYVDEVVAETRAQAFQDAENSLLSEAWPHERDERENQLIYSLVEKVQKLT